MKHIVAIGGGEIGRPCKPIETEAIDLHIISLSNKKHPNVLFLPTASYDDQKYCEIVKHYYGTRLGCHVRDLKLLSSPPWEEITSAVAWADIIYVGGGNTLSMMMCWRRLGVDRLLAEAHERGTVLCGLSAGAICWFKGGLSDSRKFTSHGRTWNFINVSGLNLVDAYICPHFDAEPERQPALKYALRGTAKVAITLDNCAALEINDDTFRIVTSRPGAKAHRVYWRNGTYITEPIAISESYRPLAELSMPESR